VRLFIGTLILLGLVSGCSRNVEDTKALEAFKNGETIIWQDTSDDSIEPLNASTCSEVLEKTHGITNFSLIKDNLLISFDLFGNQISKSKLDYYKNLDDYFRQIKSNDRQFARIKPIINDINK
jgi:ABC-type long-subunit fatty acid transport system fused permease/ATPase subunit